MNTQVTSALASPIPTTSRTRHIGLWVAQLLLALGFGAAGLMKATAPLAELHARIPWTPDVSLAFVRFVGVAEFVGALGLVLPQVTRIQPRLTSLAAAALATVMLLAAIFHVARGELAVVPVNLGLGALAAFVAWGRRR